jgi:hypothetical protein
LNRIRLNQQPSSDALALHASREVWGAPVALATEEALSGARQQVEAEHVLSGPAAAWQGETLLVRQARSWAEASAPVTLAGGPRKPQRRFQ